MLLYVGLLPEESRALVKELRLSVPGFRTDALGDVELVLDGGGTRKVAGVALAAPGKLSVDPAGAKVVEVRVTDRFGNQGSAKP